MDEITFSTNVGVTLANGKTFYAFRDLPIPPFVGLKIILKIKKNYYNLIVKEVLVKIEPQKDDEPYVLLTVNTEPINEAQSRRFLVDIIEEDAGQKKCWADDYDWGEPEGYNWDAPFDYDKLSNS